MELQCCMEVGEEFLADRNCSMDEKMEGVIKLLCSSMKLERDRGVIELEKLMQKMDLSSRQALQNKMVKLLIDSESSWQTKHGGLLGAKSLISYTSLDDDVDCNFLFNVKEVAEKLLTDIEVRVRLAAGEVLGVLCQKIGPRVYRDLRDTILKLILGNLERNLAEDDSSRLEHYETERLVEKLMGASVSKKRNDVAQVFQNTAGWKNLETGLKALQCMIEGCGINFQPYMDEELLSVLFRILTHTNRFVRESGFYVCSSLFSCCNISEDDESGESVGEVNPIYVFGHELSRYLALGLAEDWSQVRLAASMACRAFMLAIPNDGARLMFYPQLLPQMCLNRYYIADGVRIYSQETWRLVTGSAGKELVERFIGPTVEYYTHSIRSDNHAVREAACSCIAELASKISSAALRPYVDTLLTTLLTCFQDENWPVRDAACLACGNFVLCFPNESKVAMDSLYPMYYRNLSDRIPSVRQGAASALCNVVRAYGEEALSNVKSHIVDGLQNLKNQPPDQERATIQEKGTGKFVIRMRDVVDNEFHSERHPYNHVTRMGRSWIRDPQPWEVADGCISLIGELSHIKEALGDIVSFVPLLKEVADNHQYINHVVVLETICKQIPVIAKNLGKKTFKGILEQFFDAIFYSLGCENALTSSAASQCLSHIAALLGPNILRAKVQSFNPDYLKQLESVIHVAPL